MTLKDKIKEYKVRILLTVPGVLALVTMASAGELNTTISDLLYGVANIFPSLVDLVIAALPVLVIIALAGFIVGFLDTILQKIGRR